MSEKEIPILKHMFDNGEEFKVESVGDFFFKYFGPFYSLFKHHIPGFIKEIKWCFQRLFRKHGCADIDFWGLDYHLAKIILPKLIAFRSQKLHGHPMDFSDWSEDDNIGMTKEEYDEAKAKGDFIGGGHEKWLEIIDEMIFAFEYLLYTDSFDKKEKKFYEKYGYKNPYRETDDNLTWGYNYKTKNGDHCSSGDSNLEEKGYIMIGKHKSYHDMELLREISVRAKKGFELFGKYFMNLWD